MITYETKNIHPGTLPFATIYMGGLLCLGFDHANKCTIAVNNLVGNGHKWKCSIVDVDEPHNNRVVCQQEDFQPREFTEIHIDVTGGTTNGTHVYNGGPVSIPASHKYRYNLESYWVDLEGPRGHNRHIENNANTLWPRFYINEGLFCASKLSDGTFALKDSNPTPLIKPLGQIALEIVADIFLDENNPDSKIEIKLPNRTVTLKNNGKRYQIYITNDCESHVGRFHTDFHLQYNAFSGAFDGTKRMDANDQFHLVCDNGPGGGMTGLARYSDKAPCMGVVLGQTSSFN